jgi:hypothetical protein
MGKFRPLLWYVGFLFILPAWAYGVGTGKLILALPGLPMFVACIYFAIKKIICPECAKPMRMIGKKITHCPFCGTDYGNDTST